MSVPAEFIQKLQQSLQRYHLSLSDKVLQAFKDVPRINFVGDLRQYAYHDTPLAIPANQTISAPHMYAMMTATQISDLQTGMDVLEIGTGSGYGAALLARAVKPGKVVSIERHQELVEFARQNIHSVKGLNFDNLTILHGDGTDLQLPDKFDRIIVTASGPTIPPTFKDHLKPGGKIIMPLERSHDQWLTVISYDDNGEESIDWKFRVRFVPLIGHYGH